MSKVLTDKEIELSISKIIGKTEGEVMNIDILAYLSGRRVLLSGIGENKKGYVVKYGIELEKMFLYDLSIEFKEFSFKKKHKVWYFLQEFESLNTKKANEKINDLSEIKKHLEKGRIVFGRITNIHKPSILAFFPNDKSTLNTIKKLEECNEKIIFKIDHILEKQNIPNDNKIDLGEILSILFEDMIKKR